MQGFILAGGFATRLWPLTEHRAKPLLPLAGMPLLSHLIAKIPVGIPLTVSTNAVFSKDFHAWAKTIKTHRIEIRIEDTEKDDHKLGALGALRVWLEEEKVEDDVLLLAGDNYVGFDLADFTSHFKGNPLLAAHDLKDKESAKAFGTVIVDDTSHVTGFEEKPAKPKSSLVSTGCYVLPKEQLSIVIDHAKEHPDNIGGIFEEFLRRKIQIDCRTYAEPWRDIGSFRSYLEMHKEMQEGKTLADPSATIGENTTLEGSVYLGPKTKVTNSRLKNCLLFGETTLDDCVLENCIIDTGCTLRHVDFTDKMLRHGSALIGKSQKEG